MNLVIIYGPPGVGKTSTANELAKLTGYKILSNDIGNDFVKSIFEQGSEAYKEVRSRLRMILIEEAAKRDIKGLIFTHCAMWKRDQLAKKHAQIMKKFGGKIFFVQLYCDKMAFFRRIKKRSTCSVYKIDSTELWKKYENHELFPEISCVKTLKINNTRIHPSHVARQINRFFKLSA